MILLTFIKNAIDSIDSNKNENGGTQSIDSEFEYGTVSITLIMIILTIMIIMK